jgi:predicted cation transporter
MVEEMVLSPWVLWELIGIILLVLTLPFLVKKIEHNLEIFLFIMGVLAVTASNLWAKQIIFEALIEPIKITVAVLVAGLIFRGVRGHLSSGINAAISRIGIKWFFFFVVVLLGIFSSVITVIIASLVLVEIVSSMKVDKKSETNLVIIACFSLGLGAALTPIGEPLSTIAISKLKGFPYHADFWFLLKLLGWYVLPGVLILGFLSMLFKPKLTNGQTLTEDRAETLKDIFIRTVKVYLFVMALIFLGHGFKPIIDTYIVKMSAKGLYWLNMISAILDNATLTAAEITPKMDIVRIRAVLMGLLISGGMLIPGNIPNIIAAGKLKISSRDWARLGMPLGLVLMLAYFVVIFWI